MPAGGYYVLIIVGLVFFSERYVIMMKLQICCLVMICFIIGIYFSAKRKKSYEHTIFSALLLCACINLIFDGITVYTVHHLETVLPVWNMIFHKLFFTSTVVVSYLIFLYCMTLIKQSGAGNLTGKKRWLKILPFVEVILLWILPLRYVQTPNGNYSMGPSLVVVYFCIVYCFVVATACLWRYRSCINRKKKKIIFLALGIQGSVCLYQMIVPSSLVSGFGITVICLAFFMTTENPDVLLVERIKEEKKKAEEANSAKSVFLASISHEIRTPINAVIGMNEMVLRESKESAIREYAGNIKSAAQTLLGIINDILDLTKIESGKMSVYPVEYGLGSLLNDVYHMIIDRAQAKGLALRICASPDLPSVLVGDDVRIRQILMNLLTNAVKYTEKGEVVLSVSGNEHGDTVTLFFEVKDTGIGIKPENISRLFEAFERIDEIKNRSIEGIGLGLSITKQLLEKMGSRLIVESKYGKGSTFSFYLEQRIVDAKCLGSLEERFKGKAEEYVYEASLYAPEAHILVVDDNEMNRKVFCSLLKETGVQISGAGSGEECLRIVKEEHFDLIFLDHMMMTMDGIETLQKMRALQYNLCMDTPVIAFSANATSEAREQYKAAGFDGFLSKPIAPAKLEKLLREKLPQELIREHTVDQDTDDQAKVQETADDVAQKAAGKAPVEEALPYIDGIDWDYAARHFPDTESLKLAALDFYDRIDDMAEEIAGLFGEIETENGLKQYRTKVHALKSTAAMIGAIPLSGIARVLEYGAAAGELDKIRAVTPVLLDELKQYRERLGDLAPQDKEEPTRAQEHGQAGQQAEEQAAGQTGDITELYGRLCMLRNALEQMDIDGADVIAGEIRQYPCKGTLKEQMRKLSQFVRNLKFEEAHQLVTDMLPD